jgi:hypothetical protein
MGGVLNKIIFLSGMNSINLNFRVMKKIEAVVRTTKFVEIKTRLKEIGIDFFSYWEASGIGNEHLKKLVIILIICFVYSFEYSYSTPTTHLWIPSTDIQGFGKLHFGFDDFLRIKNNNGTRGGTIYCAGLTSGFLPFNKFQGELGVDYLTMSDPVYDNNPLLFNIKFGIPEDSLFKFSPAIAFGAYNIGTKRNLTDYNMYYGLIAKTIPFIGRISAGYYFGNKTVLVDENLKVENQGLLLAWDRNMSEISDKLWMAVDYQGGKNAFGVLNLGFSYAVAKNVSVLFAYDIWNNKNVYYNSKDSNINSFSVQVDINF